MTYFTATASPSNAYSMGLVERFGAEVLENHTNPYDKASERNLYGVPADQIDGALKSLISDPEGQIIINGKPHTQFFAERA